MEALIDKHSKLTEVPGEGENIIIIDGTLPFAEQYRSFVVQLQEL